MANFRDLVEFQNKFTGTTPRTPHHVSKRIIKDKADHIIEEVNELWEATVTGDYAGQADALIDIVYLAMGAAALMGLPWNKLWADVHRANMSKIPASTDRSIFDAVKPDTWRGPDTMHILCEAGYDPKNPRYKDYLTERNK